MKHLALVLSIGVVALAVRTASAVTPAITLAPPTLDHLVCYKTMDKLQVKTFSDMIAELQPEFSQHGCLLLKPIEFCVPATKTHVVGPATDPIPQPVNPNIFGSPLKNDYVCYLAKCKDQVPPPDKKVLDQFGAHLQQDYKLSKVCVPAVKAPADCSQRGTRCGGTCPKSTDVCKSVTTAGVKSCDCVPKDTACGGRPDAAGMCGGDCPPPTTADPVPQRCMLTQVTDATGTVSVKCACEKPTDPICSRDAATGACGGACPLATQKCVLNTAGQCDCETPSVPCQVTGADPAGGVQCGGACPGDVPGAAPGCRVDATTGKCSCPPSPCGHDPVTGACGGACPAPEVCTVDAAGQCGCGAKPCGIDTSTTPQTCGGACPTGQTCAIDATGACNCHNSPNPCGIDPATNACGGGCADPNEVCRVIPGTTNCECCQPAGGSCMQDSDCCSNLCNGGKCS